MGSETLPGIEPYSPLSPNPEYRVVYSFVLPLGFFHSEQTESELLARAAQVKTGYGWAGAREAKPKNSKKRSALQKTDLLQVIGFGESKQPRGKSAEKRSTAVLEGAEKKNAASKQTK